MDLVCVQVLGLTGIWWLCAVLTSLVKIVCTCETALIGVRVHTTTLTACLFYHSNSSSSFVLYTSLGQLLQVDLIKLVSVSICTSTQSVSDFNRIWCVCRGRWVIQDSMQYDPIQGHGQCHWGLRCVKMASSNMHVIKRPMVNYGTLRQFLNVDQTDF